MVGTTAVGGESTHDVRCPDWVAYTDGGCTAGRAGWAYVVTHGGDGRDDHAAVARHTGFGPVVIEEGDPAFVGATKHTNNTAELTAVVELMLALLNDAPQPPDTMGIVKTDSEIAAAAMTGRSQGGANRELVDETRRLWKLLRKRHGGRVLWRHVKGHSGHAWNDHVDALADRGGEGEVKSASRRWIEREPIPEPEVISAHGRYVFAADRIAWAQLERGEVEVWMRTTVDRATLRWLDAGGRPTRGNRL